MSAIWGIISNSGLDINKEKENILRSGYHNCVIDRFESYVGDTCAMGCGIQYFTKEAQKEILPIIDEENGIYFTADVMLDNRQELIEKLDIKDKDVADGRILFEMFHKYKEECLNDLLGIYAFVYYDKKKEECYLVSDSTGTRSLHYYIMDNTIYFSTLIEPISNACGYKELNEQWITDFLALDSMALAVGYESTPYEGIKRMAASHYIKIANEKIQKVCYWNPTTKNIKKKTDKEYEQLFKATYKQAVKRLMRNENMSILLSGGLDSTSVACLAAEEAAKSGKRITSYTSVPEKDFKCDLSSFYVTNESEAVLKTKDFLEKRGTPISCEFMDLSGINSWDGRKDEIKAVEIPYKSMQNLLWIKEGMKKAYANGSRILLTGGYGNVSISNNFISVYQYELLRKFKIIKFMQNAMGYKKKLGLTYKKMFKTCFEIIKISFKQNKKTDVNTLLGETLIKNEYIDKYNVRERFEADFEKYNDANCSADSAKRLMKNDKVFYQIGETQTKHSLATGVIQRDPTMDKRLIELCMQLPVELFGQKGIERRLVRKYLADEMPEHVIKNYNYGLQSADTANRLQKDWDRISKEIQEIFRTTTASKYIEAELALKKLDELKDFNAPNKNFEILRLEYTAMVIEYIKERFTR